MVMIIGVIFFYSSVIRESINDKMQIIPEMNTQKNQSGGGGTSLKSFYRKPFWWKAHLKLKGEMHPKPN